MSGPRNAILWCGGLAAAALVVGWAHRNNAAPVSEQEQRAMVALFLYGQDDPDSVIAPGLHGMGGQPVRIRIEQIGQCRFTVSTTDRPETIDFRKIMTIRHSLIGDPAAGLARSIDRGREQEPQPQLALAILSGAEDAVCSAQTCTDRRAFALRDAGRLEAARVSAAAFQRNDCPALTSEPR